MLFGALQFFSLRGMFMAFKPVSCVMGITCRTHGNVQFMQNFCWKHQWEEISWESVM